MFANKIIGARDFYSPIDKYKITQSQTENVFNSLVVIRDKRTKKILYIGKNRSMLTASEFFARKAFEPLDITNTTVISKSDTDRDTNWDYKTPSYDTPLSLNLTSDQTLNIKFDDLAYKVCLFCIGISGAAQGSSTKYATAKDQWIGQDNIIPFRITTAAKLGENGDKMYYGRANNTKENSEYITYYFKKIDIGGKSSNNITIKKINQSNSEAWGSSVYSDNGSETSLGLNPQVIVTCNMSVLENEGREYFLQPKNKEKNPPRFNCLSLCFATPYYDNNGNIIDYHNIRPMTRINFTDKDLSDNSSYEISYNIYF